MLFALTGLGAVMSTVPASAQILIYTGPGGFPVAVNRNYLSYYDDTWTFATRPTRFIVIPVVETPAPVLQSHASAPECLVVREKTKGPGSRVVIRNRKAC